MLEINTIVVYPDVLGAVQQSTMTQVGVKKVKLRINCIDELLKSTVLNFCSKLDLGV